MKKIVLILSVAALALASCVKTSDVYTGSPDSRQIAFSPLAQPATKAAVDGTSFPDDLAMVVTAYNATAPGNYFGATEFSKSSSTWKSDPPKYWPLTAATINFLAIANANVADPDDITWGPTISAVEKNPTEAVQIVMANNSTAQKDLMYACGTGTVAQSGNALDYTNAGAVSMVFNHAQAWIKFYVRAANEASEAVHINSITLNGVSCEGTYTVTHANWDKTAAARAAAVPAGNLDGSVSGVWSNYSGNAGNIAAVIDGGSFAGLDYDAAVLPQYFGSLMVIPDQGMASFTINYTLGGNTYDYTYTPASTSLSQANKYTYNITITLHEIEISPEVDDWDDNVTAVGIGS